MYRNILPALACMAVVFLGQVAASTPDDQRYLNQWSLARIDNEKAFDLYLPQRQIFVAVVDTGIDLTHPDLLNALRLDSSGAILGRNMLTGGSNADDDHGTGSALAGIIAAQTNNQIGVAGMANWSPNGPASMFVRLMPVKVLNSARGGSDANAANGIIWAADHGAHIIVLGYTTTSNPSVLQNAVQYALGKGCLVVAGCGDSGATTLNYPAAYAGVVSVAATDANDVLSSSSNHGTWVKVAAPGQSIYSTWKDGLYAYQGVRPTLSAAAHVAGEAAMLMAAHPNLSNAQIEELIVASVDPVTPYSGRTAGSGRINVLKALQGAGPGTPNLLGIGLQKNSVTGGASITGYVFLGADAPAGGLVVRLSSSAPATVSVPETVSIAAGTSQGSFPIGTSAVANDSAIVLSATDEAVIKTTTLSVKAPVPTAVTDSNGSSTWAAVGGYEAYGKLTISGPAPAGGLPVSMSSDTSDASPESMVLVPGGEASATFAVNTRPVAANTTARIAAAYNGQTAAGSLTVKAPTLAGLFVTTPVQGGDRVWATAILSGPAPANGMPVTLTSTHPAIAPAPAQIAIASGATAAEVSIATAAVGSDANVTLGATANAYSRTATLTVNEKRPTLAFSLSNSIVSGGSSVTATVTLSQSSTQSRTVYLSDANPDTTMPASVKILAGATSTSFSISAAFVDKTSWNTISARIGTTTVLHVLVIEPAANRTPRIQSEPWADPNPITLR